MLVILDSNVLLSAFVRVDSNPYKVVQAWIDDTFDLVSSAAQIEELSRVSRYPRIRELIGSTEAGWLVNRIRERARMIERLPKAQSRVAGRDATRYFRLARGRGRVIFQWKTAENTVVRIIAEHTGG